MSYHNTTVLGQIDPDLAHRLVSTRRGLFTSAAMSLGAIASAPLVLAAASREAFAQGGLPQQVVDVLNFALTLEHLEDSFYRKGLEHEALIPERYKDVFRHIGLHEAQHVAFLQSTLGDAAVARPEVDFTAGGEYGDVFENFDTFVTLSRTFEDLGVAAYKGQAPELIEYDDILTAALRIHSVEARHAAEVRHISGMKRWEDAFDEPLSKEEVLQAAQPFLGGM